MNTTAQFFVGVDLHKSLLQACVLDCLGAVVEEIRARIEDQVAGEDVVTRLEPYLASGRVAVESIGVNC